MSLHVSTHTHTQSIHSLKCHECLGADVQPGETGSSPPEYVPEPSRHSWTLPASGREIIPPASSNNSLILIYFGQNKTCGDIGIVEEKGFTTLSRSIDKAIHWENELKSLMWIIFSHTCKKIPVHKCLRSAGRCWSSRPHFVMPTCSVETDPARKVTSTTMQIYFVTERRLIFEDVFNVSIVEALIGHKHILSFPKSHKAAAVFPFVKVGSCLKVA